MKILITIDEAKQAVAQYVNQKFKNMIDNNVFTNKLKCVNIDFCSLIVHSVILCFSYFYI